MTLYDCCCLYLKYTFTSRCRFMTPKQVSVTWELKGQMTLKDETKDQEYTTVNREILAQVDFDLFSPKEGCFILVCGILAIFGSSAFNFGHFWFPYV